MKRIVSAAVFLLLMTVSVSAQSAPDAAELTKLLNDFLAGASRNDAAVHERFWADDLIYTRSAGRRVSKADVMRDVRSAPAPKPSDPKTVYTAEDIRIQQYGDTAVVAFRLVATTEAGASKQVANLLNSGKHLIDELSTKHLQYRKPDTTKTSIVVYGDTAIVRGESLGPNATYYTVTFINQGGAWKAVAMHTSSSK